MLTVTCPYSKAFTDFAHMRQAKWSDGRKAWLFDARDEFAVRSTLVDIFGTDDYVSCAKADVRVALDKIRNGVVGYSHLFILGRELARRKYRNYRVDLGEGVIVASGGFPEQGGSGSGAELCPYAGTVLEVRGVPIPAIEAACAKYPQAITVLGEYDLVKLQEERDYHSKRVAELDALIARHSGIYSKEAVEGVILDLQDEPDDAPDCGSREAVAG